MHDNNVRIPYNYSVHFILLLDLTFDLDVDKIATTRDEGATLTCRASIEFPPFSMLSLIKNGQMVATSINSSLQINARSINTNQFGLYICQLNASGATFRRSYTLKEKGIVNDHWCMYCRQTAQFLLHYSQFQDDT